MARERSRWALPEGKIRRDELPLAASRRELGEETTLVPQELTYLFQFRGFSTPQRSPAMKLRNANGSPLSKSQRCPPAYRLSILSHLSWHL
ncbi:NUDIX domain-containing protein [Paraburkholderia bryophila]|uniref:NUDIX domain-containing protein n=1 Tax=Paraburkholderia bryophila TaxID=420952 RepID=UPI001FC86ACE|nr:NUDIX domain-containing protein [Paraburkholderia bryophila]